MDDQQTINLACKTAQKAGAAAAELVLQYWNSVSNSLYNPELVNEITQKSDGSGNYATIADRASEDLIIRLFEEDGFGYFSVIREEGEPITQDPRWVLILDGVDGTPNLRWGLPNFGISIGLHLEGVPVVGVIVVPSARHILVARKGAGVQLLDFESNLLKNFQRWTEADSLPTDQALVGYDLGYNTREVGLGLIQKISQKIGYPVCYASVTYSIYQMVLGSLGSYFHHEPTIMDIAAAVLCLQERGGVATQLDGSPFDWKATKRSFFASRTPTMHKALGELINS